MKLSIQIIKKFDKPSVLECIRTDGSTTRTKLHQDLEIHDIAHFVVEQQLGFQNAFYGLLSKGYDIADFQLPKNLRPKELFPKNLPLEALVAEHLVNLLQIEYLKDGGEDTFLETFKTILEENNLPIKNDIDEYDIILMKRKLQELMGQWNDLNHESCLTLNLEV